MDTGSFAEPTGHAEVLRARYRSRLPERLEDLTGPDQGLVVPPLHVVWSGRTSFPLDRPKARMSLYRAVLAEGQRDDLVALLNRRLLLEQWPVLRRLISPHLRDVWEETFPDLARTASAAA
ncbi:hypothetical protein [Streptomyces sp. NPDC003710]